MTDFAGVDSRRRHPPLPPGDLVDLCLRPAAAAAPAAENRSPDSGVAPVLNAAARQDEEEF